jgi:hypothetical protein
MAWQGAQLITPGLSPYRAAVLQPVAVDCRTGVVAVVLPALSDASTTIVAIRDVYVASTLNPIWIETSDGTSVEDPSARGTFRSGAGNPPLWAHIADPNGLPVWFVGMASIGSWVIWA